MDILQDKVVKTKKEHHCFGCARKFEKGSTLRYLKQVDNGEFITSYWCKTCDEYWEKHMDPHDEIGYGDLRIGDEEGWEEVRVSIEQNENDSPPPESLIWWGGRFL